METTTTLVWTQYGACLLAIGIAGVKLTDWANIGLIALFALNTWLSFHLGDAAGH